MKPLYIGIDPGHDTGLAIYDPDEQKLISVETLRIHRALKEVADLYAMHRLPGRGIVVVFEDARKRNWLPRESSLSEWKGRAMGAGSVKRDATIWEDFLKDYGIAFINQAPRKGLTKWTEDYFQRVTGYTGRTSNHGRDAAALVFGM